MGLLDGIIDKKHILLMSSPGCGSTWLGRILSATMDYSYIHEPDNEKYHFFGYYSKQGLPRFPIIHLGEENKRIHELFQMSFYQPYITSDSFSNQLLKRWINLQPDIVENELSHKGSNPIRNLNLPYVFAHLFPKQLGNRNNRVVKSIHGMFITDYILQSFEGLQPLFMLRHPAGVIHRLLNENDEDIDRKIYSFSSILTKNKELQSINLQAQTKEFLAGLQISLFHQEIQRLMQKYSTAKIVYFEDLIADSFLFSFNLYKELDMKWNDNVELFIANSNQLGTGKKGRTEVKLLANRWEQELSDKQIEQIRFGYRFIKGVDYYQGF